MKILFSLLIVLAFTNSVSAQTLRIAVYQYADNPRIKNLQPLGDHLRQQLGIATSVKSYPTVHALIEGMQAGEVDLAFISTFGYLLLQAASKQHSMLPVAALVAPNAKDNYKTAIVCRNNAAITTLSDLKKAVNSRMAFVATGSTSGNLVPRLLLNGAGIKDADKHFAAVKYAGTHAKALQLLLSDSADVAAMGSSELDKLDSASKASLQVLALSSEIPLGPVLLNESIDQNLQREIIKALLDLHNSNAPILEAIKAAWSEAKQATHFITIKPDYYTSYLEQFGATKEAERIIQKFVQ